MAISTALSGRQCRLVLFRRRLPAKKHRARSAWPEAAATSAQLRPRSSGERAPTRASSHSSDADAVLRMVLASRASPLARARWRQFGVAVERGKRRTSGRRRRRERARPTCP